MDKPQLARPVLLIEEDALERERLYDALTRHGVSVVAVGSERHALETLKHERPGAVVVDARTADGDVAGLIERIQTVDAALPILILNDPSAPAPRNGHAHTSPHPLVLPRDIAEDDLARHVKQQLAAPDPASTVSQWPGTILIVDDEPRVRAILQDFLTIHSFATTTASSGEEALAQFEQTHPSMVLLDVCMPGMDGLLTLKKMKALRPQVTVIMITGLDEEQTFEQAQGLGADDYISKPFNLDYLQTVLLSKLLLDRTSS